MVNIFEHLKKYNIILASASPRRRRLLANLNIKFSVKVLPDIDESYPLSTSVEDIPQLVSRKKAEAYRSSLLPYDMIITADTIVAVGKQVLGKPRDPLEAHDMLKLLSGRNHRVITGVTIMTLQKTETFASVSRVQFATLNNAEIEYYIKHYKPFDKAGAYGIQEWIGMIGVVEIQGSYFNVMGLPVQKLYARLKNF